MILPDFNKPILIPGIDGEYHESSIYAICGQDSIIRRAAQSGKALLDFLQSEMMLTIGKKNELRISFFVSEDARASAARLLGSIAESIIVNLCNTDPDVNCRLGMYARNGQRASKALDSYTAIATGSKSTKTNNRIHYNPNDTQRDIIWIDNDDNEKQLQCISQGNASTISGKPAGIQVKVSTNGLGYFSGSIENYEYPILYIDLNDDFYDVLDKYPDANLIHADKIQSGLKEHLKDIYELLVALFEDRISLNDLIKSISGDNSFYESVLRTGIKSSSNPSSIVIPNHPLIS